MLFLLLFLLNPLTAQDERDFRKWLSPKRDELGNEITIKLEARPNWVEKGPKYLFDLGGDKKKETIQIIKKDGVDWVYVFDANKKEMAHTKLEAQGARPYAFKIRITNINETERLMMIHYFQGQVKGKDYYGQGRVFLWPYIKKSMKFYPLSAGPRFFIENKLRNFDYSLKKFKLSVYDVDEDGSKDIVSRLGHITKVYVYAQKGIWREI